MGSLQDALLGAGLVDKKAKKKNENKKQKEKKKWDAPKKVHTHQEHRNMCENCDKVFPDVEKYLHRNPVVRGKWLCMNCADEFMISDDTRSTNQSEYSRQRIFTRRFGRTNKGTLAKEPERQRPEEKPRGRGRNFSKDRGGTNSSNRNTSNNNNRNSNNSNRTGGSSANRNANNRNSR